jgi:hypothetical protein
MYLHLTTMIKIASRPFDFWYPTAPLSAVGVAVVGGVKPWPPFQLMAA